MPTRAATWPSGTRVVWRGLTWGEYRKVHSLQGPPAEKALEVYTLCVIDGPRPERIPAGIMMWISTYELDKSPFSGSFKALSLPLEEARTRVTGSYLLSAQAFIASVFKVPFEKMDEWDSETFLTRVAQAEFVAGVPLNPLDPQAAANGSLQGKSQRPKKALTNAQQIALERRNNDRSNFQGPGKTSKHS